MKDNFECKNILNIVSIKIKNISQGKKCEDSANI